MARRQRQWARHTRDLILGVLGPKCVACGATEDLTFDVIHPQEPGDKHHAMEWSWRMSFYRKMFYANNLQVLCDKCNTRKSNQLQLTLYAQIEQPF